MQWIKRQFVDMFHFLHALWVPFIALVGIILFTFGVIEMTAGRYEIERFQKEAQSVLEKTVNNYETKQTQTEEQTLKEYYRLTEGETGMLTGASATVLIYSGGAIMLYAFFAHKSHGEKTKKLERLDLEQKMAKQAKEIKKREDKLQADIEFSKRYREKILPTMAALTIAIKHRSWEPVSAITHDVKDFIRQLDNNVEDTLGISHQKEVPLLEFDEPLESSHEEGSIDSFPDDITKPAPPPKKMRFMEHVNRDAKLKEKEKEDT